MAAGQDLAGQRILLGITGGIAAYKSVELARELQRAGAEVQVVMTEAATRFVTSLTFQAISGRRVRTSLWDVDAEAAMGHLELARWADRIVVAPASADFMARLAHGFSDDLLTTLCLASEAPIVLAPAMNRVMWASATTRDNAERLSGLGVRLLGPAEGELAEGETGAGRMLEPEEIVAALGSDAEPGSALAGMRVIVTAGPTREPIDPVRYVTNRSSGRMGFAVAEAAAARGADVTLIAGPVSQPTPAGVMRVDVDTAEAMRDAVSERIGDCDIFIGAAAVADYRPSGAQPGKIKKRRQSLSVTMERTPDILAMVAQAGRRPFTVGFAAETENLVDNAEAKRRDKGLDLVAANLVGPGLGFDTDDNALHVLWEGGDRILERQAKGSLAAALVELIAERYAARRDAA